MDVTLPADLTKQVEQELASGRYQSPDELIEQAVRQFLDERQRGQRRLDAIRRIGQSVDRAARMSTRSFPARNDVAFCG
jgi:Arc/MetJ-type ribon-helix-helix transcriptional regulator